MVPGQIVMPEVLVERLLQVVSVLEGREVDALVFDAPPEPFHEDFVMVVALAVHADPDAMAFENACEGITGELDTLIRIDEKAGGRSSPPKAKHRPLILPTLNLSS